MKKRKWTAAALAMALVVFAPCIQTDAAETERAAAFSASDLCVDSAGQLCFTDSENNVVRQLSDEENNSILAGREDAVGYLDGKAATAQFDGIWGIASYKGGYVVADTENNVIRLVKNGKVSTYAGTGTVGKRNQTRKKARFNRPTGLAVGDNGELYVADTGNSRIRVIDKKGNVTTYAGSSSGCADGTLKKAKFNEPTDLFYVKGVLYVADSGNHRICRIKNGKVTTIAGSATGIEGSKDGKAADSLLSYPQGICVSNGVVYIADTGNSCIRQVKSGKVSTLLEAYSQQDGLLPSAPRGILVKGGYLYIGDVYADQVIKQKL